VTIITPEFVVITSHGKENQKNIDINFTFDPLPFCLNFVARFNKSVIRIFALEEEGGVDVDFTCRWWSGSGPGSSGKDVLHQVPAKRFWIDTSWPHWSSHFACEYACTVPDSFHEPTIQLTSDDQTFSFKVEIEYVPEASSRKKLAVCLKPQTNSQLPKRLVEWFEMLQAVGINDVIGYTTDVTGSGRYVFQYYEEQGVLTTVPFPYLITVLLRLEQRFPKMSGGDRFALYQQVYLIAMHDCLYRFRKAFDYILFLDIDEMITPSDAAETVQDVLDRALDQFPFAAGFLFLTSWHWEDFGAVESEDYLYMQTFSKGTVPMDKGSRSIISTYRAITVNFQEVLDVPKSEFTSEVMAWKDYAYIHHFRGKCQDMFREEICNGMLPEGEKGDKTITRLKDDVEDSVRYVLEQLQLN
jgi:hypothetical protein